MSITLAAGQSTTVALPDTGTFAVATNGGYWTSLATPSDGSGPATVTHGPLSSHRVFGPYAGGGSVVVTNTSCDSLIIVQAGPVGLTAAQTAAGGFVTGPKFLKLRRIIAAAKGFNSIDNVAAVTQPTITTTFDAALSQFITCDPTSAVTASAMNLLGGVWTKDGANPRWLPVADSVDPGKYSVCTYEFCSDAPKLQIRTAAGTLYITVNGYPINKAGVANAGSGGENQVVLDWTGDAAGARRARTYRVSTIGGIWAYRVGIDPQSHMWAPERDDIIRAYFDGDSYIANTQGNSGLLLPQQSMSFIMCEKLGIRDFWNGGVGGTGYVQPGAATTLRGRAASVIAAQPDVVFIGGGTNDAPFTQAAVQAEAALYFPLLRAGLPGVPIIVFGPWSKNTGPSAGMLGVEAGLQAALAAINDPLIGFAPTVSDAAGAWVSGTGYDANGTPTGSATGNAQLYIGADQAHPNLAGHAYHGQRCYSGASYALRQMLGAS